jgi:hypothetical protein
MKRHISNLLIGFSLIVAYFVAVSDIASASDAQWSAGYSGGVFGVRSSVPGKVRCEGPWSGTLDLKADIGGSYYAGIPLPSQAGSETARFRGTSQTVSLR